METVHMPGIHTHCILAICAQFYFQSLQSYVSVREPKGVEEILHAATMLTLHEAFGLSILQKSYIQKPVYMYR